ncbi:MAG: ATP-binding protein [Eubacterium sp.]|nr:ATP-binding protein [Eubacterium sp.]
MGKYWIYNNDGTGNINIRMMGRGTSEMAQTRGLILYRNNDKDWDIFSAMVNVYRMYLANNEEDEYDYDDDDDDDDDFDFDLDDDEIAEMHDMFYHALSDLVEMACRYGFAGNLWHVYLTYLIVTNDNAYTRSAELKGNPGGSLSDLALHDFSVFMDLFDLPIGQLADFFGEELLMSVGNFTPPANRPFLLDDFVVKEINALTKKLSASGDATLFKEFVESFYEKYGAGKIGLHKAFRIDRETVYDSKDHKSRKVVIAPVEGVCHVTMDELIGYEAEKKKLIDNTKAFVEGRPANNVLLYGEAGTGKSTSVKALMDMFAPQGLRIIELYKDQFKDLNELISLIKNRSYRFIIFMDDLSFEEFEVEYKHLKALIEGGIEKRPDNILIYATSNRRHLMKETFSDKNDFDNDLHSSETVEEKTSLSGRFGLQIRFGSPSPKDYETMIKTMAEREGITASFEDYEMESRRWQIQHGGYSGRTARQFVDHLKGSGGK